MQVRAVTPLTEMDPLPEGNYLAISKGEQPSIGYGFEGLQASTSWSVLYLDVGWYAPTAVSETAGTPRIQITSTPCMVVELAELDGIEKIHVRVNGETHAAIPPPSS